MPIPADTSVSQPDMPMIIENAPAENYDNIDNLPDFGSSPAEVKVENDETMEEADEAMTAAEGEYNAVTGADITELPSTDA